MPKILQLWRGEGALKGLVSVGGPKRSAINNLLTKIHQFGNIQNGRRPFNCLVLSSPGWGKSFLARCLAKYFDLTFLDFSLSQMATTGDLIDCFDMICSTQNRSDKKVLVFLDEINCEIEGNSAMGLLLSPIWDGAFISRGKFYRLDPAVWIFASTGPLDELVLSNKGSDFIPRLNGPIIELDPMVAKAGGTNGSVLLDLIKTLKQRVIGVRQTSDKSLVTTTEELFDRAVKLKGVFRTEQTYLGVTLLKSPLKKCFESERDLFSSNQGAKPQANQ